MCDDSIREAIGEDYGRRAKAYAENHAAELAALKDNFTRGMEKAVAAAYRSLGRSLTQDEREEMRETKENTREYTDEAFEPDNIKELISGWWHENSGMAPQLLDGIIQSASKPVPHLLIAVHNDIATILQRRGNVVRYMQALPKDKYGDAAEIYEAIRAEFPTKDEYLSAHRKPLESAIRLLHNIDQVMPLAREYLDDPDDDVNAMLCFHSTLLGEQGPEVLLFYRDKIVQADADAIYQ